MAEPRFCIVTNNLQPVIPVFFMKPYSYIYLGCCCKNGYAGLC